MNSDIKRVKHFFSKVLKRSIVVICAVFIAGCAPVFSLYSHSKAVEHIASSHGLTRENIKAGEFMLTAYYRIAQPGAPLHVYIEGDGRAWLSRSRVSSDPTPNNPLVLNLASIDNCANIVYLARPGQYEATATPSSDPTYWSDKRFAPEVISAMNEAIEHFHNFAGGSQIDLIGYSGGAAIAVLIAAQRDDIISIRTIAGNLDINAVSAIHKVSPLNGSLNPIDYAKKVAHIPQLHFVGGRDTIIPQSIANSFITNAGLKIQDHIVVIKEASHTSGWLKEWQRLLRM